MKIMRTLVIAMLLSFVASCALAAALPAFKLKDLEGKEVSSDVLKGKPSLLIIAQMACSQCRAEIEEVEGKLDQVKAKANYYVILVDTAPERAVDIFKKKYTSPALLDPSYSVGASIDLSATPATIVLDKDLNVVLTKVGYRSGQLADILGKL